MPFPSLNIIFVRHIVIFSNFAIYIEFRSVECCSQNCLEIEHPKGEASLHAYRWTNANLEAVNRATDFSKCETWKDTIPTHMLAAAPEWLFVTKTDVTSARNTSMMPVIFGMDDENSSWRDKRNAGVEKDCGFNRSKNKRNIFVVQWKGKKTPDENGYSKTETLPIWKLIIYIYFQHLWFRTSETGAYFVWWAWQ